MDIVLVPGLWLDGSSWDRVVPALEEHGHRTHSLTLPGLESVAADRSAVGTEDQVAAVVSAVDACPADEQALVVGHSLGCGIAYGAIDRRPDRVARGVYVGGWPATDGSVLAEGFATDGADMPMPDFGEFDDADLKDLDEAALGRFRARAVPSPARLTTDVLRLTDERRFAVPATMICPEYRPDQLREWVSSGEASVAELTRIKDVEYVDLPTGHWPQFTKPAELAQAILDAMR